MVNYLGFLAVASTLLSTALAQYAGPGPCSGVCVNTHDPSVVRRESDGTYFRFSTGGKIAVHTAPDISGPWEYKGAAIPAGSIINLPGRNDLWAPDVTLVGNTYYLYYSVSSFGAQNSAIGYATSPTMDVGSWTDHGSTGIESGRGKPYNAIDPALLWANNKFHMTFGSFWDGIYQVSMEDAPAKTTGSSHKVAQEPVTTAVEGPYIFPWDKNYYLFWSEGKCCGYDNNRPPRGKEYKIMVCRSTDPTSGFVDANGKDCRNGGGTVVLQSHDNVYGPGGQGVMMDSKYGPILYYHYVDTNIGYGDGQKQFGWNKLDFSSGWPVAK